MVDVIDFKQRRLKKEQANNNIYENPLKIVDEILLNPKVHTDFCKEVKNLLKNKQIKYRISHKEVSAKIAPKSKTILFPNLNLVFVLGGDEDKREIVKNWSILTIKVAYKARPFDVFEQIVTELNEVKK